MEFLYCPNPEADEPILLVNTHIGEDENKLPGVMGDLFQKELISLQNQGKKSVEVWVNTVGGSVTHGWNIYGVIDNMNQSGKMVVNTLNIGIAASVGSWVFGAGKKREMMDYAVLMMHNAHGGSGEGDEEINNSIATMLSSKSGKTKEEIRALMNKTTFMTAQECLANGFCDSIRNSGNAMATVGNDQTQKWEAGNKFLNKFLGNKTTYMSVNKINNLLNLNDEASADSQVAAIKNIIQESQTAKENLTKVQNEMAQKETDAKEAMDKKNGEYDELKGKYDKLVADNATKEAEAVENSSKELIEGYANKGLIKNDADTINHWLNTAKKLGIEETKKLIVDLPVNKQAPTYVPKVEGDAVFTNFASAMIDKENKIK